MADLGDRTINLGSIREEAVGRTVPVKMIDNSFAKCLEIDARTSPYKFPGAVNEQYIPEPNCEFSDIIDLISDDGNGIIIAGRRSVNIGPIQLDSLGERVRVEMIDHQFGTCLTPEIRARDYQSWLKERGVDSAAYEKQKKDIIRQTESSGLNTRNKQISGESGSKSPNPDTSRTEPSSADSKPVTPGKSKLKELREKAEDAATDNPTRDTSATIGSRYIRAPAIKEYAQARAEGYCEYCGELAPFETNDGEPYLEVHHVDELGEGGVDHPDKVVALIRL